MYLFDEWLFCSEVVQLSQIILVCLHDSIDHSLGSEFAAFHGFFLTFLFEMKGYACNILLCRFSICLSPLAFTLNCHVYQYKKW